MLLGKVFTRFLPLLLHTLLLGNVWLIQSITENYDPQWVNRVMEIVSEAAQKVRSITFCGAGRKGINVIIDRCLALVIWIAWIAAVVLGAPARHNSSQVSRQNSKLHWSALGLSGAYVGYRHGVTALVSPSPSPPEYF